MVTATKEEVISLDVPAGVTILTSEDIDKGGYRSTSDLIGDLPGITDQSLSDSFYYDFRGTRSADAPGPHILLNGREVNLGIYGSNIIGSIPIESIDRIEVIRTPGAYISGRDSSRGVINIITKRGYEADKPFSPKLGYSYGSWNTHTESFSLTGKKGKANYYINQTYKESDGYRNTNPVYHSVLSSFDYEINKALKLGVDVQYNKESRAYALGLKQWQIDAGYGRDSEVPSSQGPTAYMQKQSTVKNEVLGGTVSLNYDAAPYRGGIFFNITDYDERYELRTYDNSPTLKKSHYDRQRTQNIYEAKLVGRRSFGWGKGIKDTIEAGYEYSYRGGDQDTVYPFDPSAAAREKEAIATIDFTENYHALFLNNKFNYKKFGIDSGLRYEMPEYEVSNEEPRSVKADFGKLAWNIAPWYRPVPTGNLYFSVSRSYFYPTAGYYYTAMTKDAVENRPEDLRPEETTSYEIGFKHNFKEWFTYSISLFYMKVKDRFLTFYDDTGTSVGWKNVGDSTNKGLEFEAQGRPLNWLGYDFNYSLTDATWDNGVLRIYEYGATPTADVARNMDITGKYVANVPKHKYRLGLTFYPPIAGLQLNFGLSGAADSYIDGWNRYKNETEYLVDAKISYEKRNWKAYLSAANLFDKEYYYVYNTSSGRNADGTPDNSYYLKNGLYMEAGISYKF
jgi:iron complex outermembrane receptor protein